MMRSFLYCHLFSLTTIVASLSLGNLDQVGRDGDAVQPMAYITAGNNEDPSRHSALGLDTIIIPGWAEVTGTEQAQANKGTCSSPHKKRRRGESNYCSPTAAPPPLQFRPDSNQKGPGPGGSTTTTTTTTGQQDSSQSGLLLDNSRFDKLQFAPWSSTQSACPGSRPVPVCAGADIQPWELGPGWRQIPFSSPLPSPVELLYWPYCRLWTYNLPCKIELNLEMFMCCEYIERNSPTARETIFQLRVWRYMALEYPYNGHSCIPAIEPRLRL